MTTKFHFYTQMINNNNNKKNITHKQSTQDNTF